MADAPVPIEERTKALSQPFQDSLSRLTSSLAKLKARPLTAMTYELWLAWDSEAQTYLKQIGASELAKQTNAAYRVHRFLTAALNGFTNPIEEGRRIGSRAMASWKRELERKRRAREIAVTQQQEQERDEQATHLETLGHTEEAQALREEPPIPVSLPDEKPSDGVIVITVYKVDAEEPLSDGKAFFQWLAEHQEMWRSIEFKVSDWKHALTKQNVRPPGLRFVEETETRHR